MLHHSATEHDVDAHEYDRPGGVLDVELTPAERARASAIARTAVADSLGDPTIALALLVRDALRGPCVSCPIATDAHLDENRECATCRMKRATTEPDPRDCVCGGTGHDFLGDPCDGKAGDGCLTRAENRAFAAQLVAHRHLDASEACHGCKPGRVDLVVDDVDEGCTWYRAVNGCSIETLACTVNGERRSVQLFYCAGCTGQVARTA